MYSLPQIDGPLRRVVTIYDPENPDHRPYMLVGMKGFTFGTWTSVLKNEHLVFILRALLCGGVVGGAAFFASKRRKKKEPDMRNWPIEKISVWVSRRYAKAFKRLAKH
jgi:hypothetical protein